MSLQNPQWAGKCRVDVVSWAESTGHGLSALAEAAPERADGAVLIVEPERAVEGESELHFVRLQGRIQAVCRRHSAAAVAAVVGARLPATHKVVVVTRHDETCVVWGSAKGLAKFVADAAPYRGPATLEACPTCAAIAATIEIAEKDFRATRDAGGDDDDDD